jgi:uncharacterized protein YbcI
MAKMYPIGSSKLAGTLKQEILKIYNEINLKIFNAGVKQQKVDFVGNKIIIVSVNHRVPVLRLLDDLDETSIRNVSVILGNHFKAAIKEAFEREFQMNIVTILKDYDVKTEHSGTIVILDRDVESYLNDEL